jgi:hypothetical protein
MPTNNESDRREQKRNADPLNLLSNLASGIFTVDVNDLPFLKVDAKTRSVEVETRGVKECGITLSNIIELQGDGKGVRALLKGSESTAKGLSEKGWKLILSDRNSTLITMGRGVSRLSGYMRINPLKLRKVLEII